MKSLATVIKLWRPNRMSSSSNTFTCKIIKFHMWRHTNIHYLLYIYLFKIFRLPLNQLWGFEAKYTIDMINLGRRKNKILKILKKKTSLITANLTCHNVKSQCVSIFVSQVCNEHAALPWLRWFQIFSLISWYLK